MGVDYYTCNHCDETFPDCGPMIWCACGNKWDYDECAAADGYVEPEDDYEDEGTCAFCRNEKATDEQLLAYLIDQVLTTRVEVEERYLALKEKLADEKEE
jgi:hypothetical protein